MKVDRKIVGRRTKLINILKKIKEDKPNFLATKASTKLIRHLLNNPEEYSAPTEDGQSISYSRNPKEKYSEKYRMSLKLRRFLTRKAYLDYPSSNALAFEIETRINPDIFKWDIQTNIAKYYRIHFGGASCMTGITNESQQEIKSFYHKNLDKVNLLTVKYGTQTGRALLWNCDNGITFLDRIYSDSDVVTKWIKLWTKERKILVRNGPKYDTTLRVVVMKKGSDRWDYPYLDSFQVMRYWDYKINTPPGKAVLINKHNTYKIMTEKNINKIKKILES